LFISAVTAGLLLIFKSAYRRQRLLTFFNPTEDPLGASYHIRQVLIALGAGGLFGIGLGQSRQKYQFLPEATSDSIFAIIAEETGFLGAVLVIIIFLAIFFRGLSIAQNAKDDFGRLLASGIVGWVGIQTLVNLAAMVSLIPLTGLPLPFVSYGGSSLIVALTSIGILLSISRFS
jgi:cell division protein FtsW